MAIELLNMMELMFWHCGYTHTHILTCSDGSQLYESVGLSMKANGKELYSPWELLESAQVLTYPGGILETIYKENISDLTTPESEESYLTY